MYLYTHMNICTHVYICMFIVIQIHMYAYIYVFVCVSIYVCIYVDRCIYIHTRIYSYVFIYKFVWRAYTTFFFQNSHTHRRACNSMAWVHIHIYARIYVHKDSAHLNRCHWLWYTPDIHQIEKLKFLSTLSD